MNCIMNGSEQKNDQEDLLLGYCQGTLAPAAAATYERHLADCADCREAVALQKLVDESLSAWQPPEVSANFDALLFARIRETEAVKLPWYREIFQTNWGWKPAFPLALAALALAVFLMRPVEVPTTEAFKADEIEQVERALDDMEALQILHQPEAEPPSKGAL